MKPFRNLPRCERGSATVEAALVVPFLLTIGLGASEVANVVNETHRMKTGLASGARMLARAQNPSALEAEARNVAVTGVRAGGKPRAPGWTTAHVTVSYRWVDNASETYTGGDTIRIVRLSSTKPYSGVGLLALARGRQVSAFHEERWTGG